MFVSLLRSWRSTQSLSAIVPVTRQFKNNSHILAKELFPLQGCQTAEIHCENQPPEYATVEGLTRGRQEGLIEKLSRNLKTRVNSLWKALSSQAEESSLGKPNKLAQRNSKPGMVRTSPARFDDVEGYEDESPFSSDYTKHLPSTGLRGESFEETEGIHSDINTKYFEKFRWRKEPTPTKMMSVDAIENSEKEMPEWEVSRDIVLVQTGQIEGAKFLRTLESGLNALWEAIPQAEQTCLENQSEDIKVRRNSSSGLVFISPEAMLDDMERCEDRLPPCPYEPERLPFPCLKEDCSQAIEEEFWSDIDANWYYEKFPWKKECCSQKTMSAFAEQNDDPTANGLL